MARRSIFLIILVLCACTTALHAQLVFTPSERDFGTINESDGRVTHSFTGENRGAKPVAILDVVTTCGCTVPEFSKQPILPGGKSTIKVTFDPANRPGTFAKDLTVYSTERKKIATLTIRGNVAPRERSLEEVYPVDAGGGLRLGSTLSAFSYIYEGERVQSSISYANTTNQPITLLLESEVPSGLLTLDYPRRIAPGEKGEINLSYLIPAGKPRYGTIRDVINITVEGRTSKTVLMAHGIGTDNPKNTPHDKAPKAEMEDNILKFGSVKRTSSRKSLPITLSNKGLGPLMVRAVESDGRIGSTLRPGQQIAPGATFKAEVTLDPGEQAFGVLTDQLLIITNDPNRPMRRIRVTAIIEE